MALSPSELEVRLDGNALPVPKDDSDKAMDAAACIGCGACVASCKNASAMLFTSAKAGHLNMLPQGQAEKDKRVLAMVEAMDDAGFGNCRNYGECSAACPKDISLITSRNLIVIMRRLSSNRFLHKS